MATNQKTLTHLLQELSHLLLWMSRQENNNPILLIENTIKEEKKKLTAIAAEANQLIRMVPTFVERVINDPTVGPKIAEEFIERSRPLLELLNKTLNHHRKIIEEIATPLMTLSRELTSGIMHLKQHFKKHIQPLPNQLPIKHHVKNLQNTAEKSRFILHQVENHPTFHHRNISPRNARKG